jgi:hypothetical protein
VQAARDHRSRIVVALSTDFHSECHLDEILLQSVFGVFQQYRSEADIQSENITIQPDGKFAPVLRLESGLAQKPGFHLQEDVCGGDFVPAEVEVCVVIAGIWLVDNIDQAVDGADLSLRQVAKCFFAGYLSAARPVIGFKRVYMLVHGEVRSGVR